MTADYTVAHRHGGPSQWLHWPVDTVAHRGHAIHFFNLSRDKIKISRDKIKISRDKIKISRDKWKLSRDKWKLSRDKWKLSREK